MGCKTKERGVGQNVIENVFEGLLQFYGQEIYNNIGENFASRSIILKLAFRIIRLCRTFVFFNFIFLIILILFLRIYRYPDDKSKVFMYGTTNNNITALRKLQLCLPEEMRGSISENFRFASMQEKVKAICSVTLLFSSAKLLAKEGHPDSLVHTKAAIGVSATILYFTCPLPDNVKVVCVASDHSPVARALIEIAKNEGRKTCYVQHAPVTEYFPPLNTNLSILYDEKSVNAYKLAAKKVGKSFDAKIELMPPFSDSFQQPTLGQGPYTIGICLSRFPQLNMLRGFLDDLSCSKHVKTICLRRHPACKLDLTVISSIAKVEVRDKGESLTDFSKAVDMALVPSSGVAVELLHSGVPTFYVKGMDELADDYYGFVREGILPKFDESISFDSVSVSSFFGSAWIDRFSGYDVTVYKSVDIFKSQVGDAFSALMFDQ